MADYHKKVIYLSYLEQGNRIKGAGFIKAEVLGDKWTFNMRVSGMAELEEKKYDIYVVSIKEEEYKIGGIFLHRGNGEWKKSGEGYIIAEAGLNCGGIRQFLIRISDSEVIEGRCQMISAASKDRSEKEYRKESQDREKESRREEKPLRVAEKTSVRGEKANREILGGQGKEIKMEEMILNDKWEQLCRMYPVVHPYEDERKYISIQPKDFVVMTGDYQHLANNSFLLHGFYNYRHIVLGREPLSGINEGRAVKEPGKEKADRGKNKEACGDFFLGVPGVYYEREKMVALMFGFEAFECCGGKAEPGKFGYYLRRVKI